MSEFYAESGYALDATRAAEAFHDLLSNEQLGRAWLLEVGGGEAGYLVVTLGYSMEYGGRDAFIDDLYVRKTHRGKGLGTAAIQEAMAYCVATGVRAIHLEADQGNSVAMHLYREAGFATTGRELLTLRLGKTL